MGDQAPYHASRVYGVCTYLEDRPMYITSCMECIYTCVCHKQPCVHRLLAMVPVEDVSGDHGGVHARPVQHHDRGEDRAVAQERGR